MTSTHSQPLLIAVAPNGAYKTAREHSELPITAAQLADTAVHILQTGARMLHLHVRDEYGRHTLAASTYQIASKAIRATVGNELFIQFTSESAGMYTAAQQRQAIYALSGGDGNRLGRCDKEIADEDGRKTGTLPDGISIAPCELIRTPDAVPAAKKLFHHLARHNIVAQYILYSFEDIARYHTLLEQEIIPPDNHSVLLVVGKPNVPPATLQQMLDALQTSTNQMPNWMVCAFGKHEFACLVEATKLGGHVRVGFENNLYLNSGEMASNNAQLVTQFIESGNPNSRPLADAQQAWKILK